MGSSWYSDLEGEPSPLLMAATDQRDFMDYIDQELASILGEDIPNTFSPESSSSSTLINNGVIIPGTAAALCAVEPPAKQRKTNNSRNRASRSPVVLNFDNGIPSDQSAPPPPQPPLVRKSRVRPPSQTYDHIIAERKRREQLSQRFVALSAIVPGLKKMDKTSVLGDAIKYMKHLQERVKILEEQAAKHTVESVVLVKKSQIMVEDECSSDEKSCSSDEQPLPEIEARVCNRTILIKIHCHKRKGVLVKILAQVETLNLSVASTSVAPFGNLALDITIIAEMEKETSLAAEDVVKALRLAILQATN